MPPMTFVHDLYCAALYHKGRPVKQGTVKAGAAILFWAMPGSKGQVWVWFLLCGFTGHRF